MGKSLDIISKGGGASSGLRLVSTDSYYTDGKKLVEVREEKQDKGNVFYRIVDARDPTDHHGAWFPRVEVLPMRYVGPIIDP